MYCVHFMNGVGQLLESMFVFILIVDVKSGSDWAPKLLKS